MPSYSQTILLQTIIFFWLIFSRDKVTISLFVGPSVTIYFFLLLGVTNGVYIRPCLSARPFLNVPFPEGSCDVRHNCHCHRHHACITAIVVVIITESGRAFVGEIWPGNKKETN